MSLIIFRKRKWMISLSQCVCGDEKLRKKVLHIIDVYDDRKSYTSIFCKKLFKVNQQEKDVSSFKLKKAG